MDTVAGHSAATDIYSACWRVVRMGGMSACASTPSRVLACAVGGRKRYSTAQRAMLVRGRLDLQPRFDAACSLACLLFCQVKVSFSLFLFYPSIPGLHAARERGRANAKRYTVQTRMNAGSRNVYYGSWESCSWKRDGDRGRLHAKLVRTARRASRGPYSARLLSSAPSPAACVVTPGYRFRPSTGPCWRAPVFAVPGSRQKQNLWARIAPAPTESRSSLGKSQSCH